MNDKEILEKQLDQLPLTISTAPSYSLEGYQEDILNRAMEILQNGDTTKELNDNEVMVILNQAFTDVLNKKLPEAEKEQFYNHPTDQKNTYSENVREENIRPEGDLTNTETELEGNVETFKGQVLDGVQGLGNKQEDTAKTSHNMVETTRDDGRDTILNGNPVKIEDYIKKVDEKEYIAIELFDQVQEYAANQMQRLEAEKRAIQDKADRSLGQHARESVVAFVKDATEKAMNFYREADKAFQNAISMIKENTLSALRTIKEAVNSYAKDFVRNEKDVLKENVEAVKDLKDAFVNNSNVVERIKNPDKVEEQAAQNLANRQKEENPKGLFARMFRSLANAIDHQTIDGIEIAKEADRELANMGQEIKRLGKSAAQSQLFSTLYVTADTATHQIAKATKDCKEALRDIQKDAKETFAKSYYNYLQKKAEKTMDKAADYYSRTIERGFDPEGKTDKVGAEHAYQTAYQSKYEKAVDAQEKADHFKQDMEQEGIDLS